MAYKRVELMVSLFGVQEGDVQAGSVTQRDHDTGPLKYLIRGADDDYNDC